MGCLRTVPDADIIAVLNASPGMKAACAALNVTRQALHARCRKHPPMRSAYLACGRRGYRHTNRGFAKHCRLCGGTDHNRQNCAMRAEPSSRRCRQCENLPWRRPMNKRRLCKCGEAYAPEPSITLDSVFLMANHNRREVI